MRRTPNLISLVLVVVLAGLLFGACRAGPDEAGDADASVPALDGSTTSEAPPSTTTTSEPASPPSTVYAPDTIEGRIEADYLAAWDAYAEACATADTSPLEHFYADAALGYREQNVQQLIDEGVIGECVVEHAYNVALVGNDLAAVSDNYVNHMRLVDPRTGSYLEADPNVRDGSVYTLEKRDETWIVTDINGLEPS